MWPRVVDVVRRRQWELPDGFPGIRPSVSGRPLSAAHPAIGMPDGDDGPPPQRRGYLHRCDHECWQAGTSRTLPEQTERAGSREISRLHLGPIAEWGRRWPLKLGNRSRSGRGAPRNQVERDGIGPRHGPDRRPTCSLWLGALRRPIPTRPRAMWRMEHDIHDAPMSQSTARRFAHGSVHLVVSPGRPGRTSGRPIFIYR